MKLVFLQLRRKTCLLEIEEIHDVIQRHCHRQFLMECDLFSLHRKFDLQEYPQLRLHQPEQQVGEEDTSPIRSELANRYQREYQLKYQLRQPQNENEAKEEEQLFFGRLRDFVFRKKVSQCIEMQHNLDHDCLWWILVSAGATAIGVAWVSASVAVIAYIKIGGECWMFLVLAVILFFLGFYSLVLVRWLWVMHGEIKPYQPLSALCN